jgi:hypothetical protein
MKQPPFEPGAVHLRSGAGTQHNAPSIGMPAALSLLLSIVPSNCIPSGQPFLSKLPSPGSDRTVAPTLVQSVLE